MNITVKGIHLDTGDALKTHVDATLGALAEKYVTGGVLDATVTFTKEKNSRFTAHLSLRVERGHVFEASAEAEEPYPAFDAAAQKLGSRLRRYKDRIRDHHRNKDPVETHFAAYATLAAEDDAEVEGEEPAVIAEMEMPVMTLAVADAVMQLELRDLPAMIFRNAAHGGYNMVYRRQDGNIGWVDPEGLVKEKNDGNNGEKRASA